MGKSLRSTGTATIVCLFESGRVFVAVILVDALDGDVLLAQFLGKSHRKWKTNARSEVYWLLAPAGEEEEDFLAFAVAFQELSRIFPMLVTDGAVDSEANSIASM